MKSPSSERCTICGLRKTRVEYEYVRKDKVVLGAAHVCAPCDCGRHSV